MSADIIHLRPPLPQQEDELEILKRAYGLEDHAEIMKRALAIALIANKQADADGYIHFLKRDGANTAEVIVPQRY